MNNFTALRYLDIPEDPTFIPLVASERKEHKSESKNVSAILQSLMESRHVCNLRGRKDIVANT